MSPLWIAAVPGLLAIWLWAILDLQRFVLFAVLSAMILPQALVRPAGTQVALADVLLLVALAAWLVAARSRATPSPLLARSGLLVAALVFVAVNFESMAWSDHPWETLPFAIQLAEIVIVFPVIFACMPRSLSAVESGFAIFIVSTCILAVVFTAGGGDQIPGAPGKNTVGSFLAAGLVMAYSMTLVKRRVSVQALLLLALTVELGGLVAIASRGSIVGAVVALVAMSLLLQRRRLLTGGVVLATGLAFLTIHGTDSRPAAEQRIRGSFDTSTLRHYSLRNAIDKIEERPFLGSGAGTYTDYIQELDTALPDPNNMFLLTWAEVGILGVLALLCLLWQYARLMTAVSRLKPADATIAVGAGCVALSLLVHFQVDVTWTRGTSSLAFAMMGLMLAVQRIAALATDKATRDSERPAYQLRRMSTVKSSPPSAAFR